MRADAAPSLVLHTDAGVFDELAAGWSALASAAGAASPFAGPGFARAWWSAWGDGRDLLVARASDAEGRLLALVPLRHDPLQGEVRFLADGRADYAASLAVPGAEPLLRRLVDLALRTSGARRAVLRRMPTGARTTKALASHAGPAPTPTRVLRAVDARRLPGVATSDPGHLLVRGTELEALAASLERYSSARHLRWYAARGGLRHRVLEDPAEIAAHMDAFMALHRRDFAARQMSSLFEDPAAVSFYRSLPRQPDLAGVLRLDLLEHDGRPIAAHVGFQTSEAVQYYKPAMEPTEASRRPGKLLLAHLARQALATGRSELDLLSGEEPYKHEVATTRRGITTLVVAGSRRRLVRERLARTVATGRRRATRTTETMR
jgi:CelD/BcsL family acetyltransferase involved in cellulose biosynthesis